MTGAPLEFRVLGPLEVYGANGPVLIGSANQRRLLTALVLDSGSVVSVDRLLDVLWGDDPPRTAVTTLRTYVARLRATLRTAYEGPSPLTSSPPGYLLEIEPDAVDARRFERVVQQAREKLGTDPVWVSHALQQALQSWRGPALAEFADEDFARLDAVRLDELRVAAREIRSAALVGSQRYAEAAAELESLVAGHPLREEAQALLLTALARSGQVPRAIATYQAYIDLLRDEVGAGPSARLQRLRYEIGPGPEPAAGRRVRGNLPIPLSTLVGRDLERRQTVRTVGRRRMVTLTGTGGVGKTALALHAATALRPEFPDGVWLCTLAPLRTPDAVPHALAATLGVVLPPDRPPDLGITAALGARRLLIVLDNCEHLLDAAARLTSSLLQHCPHIRVLATSRERLGVDGEHLLPLSPLATPDAGQVGTAAVELFTERARAARPDFAVTPATAPLVATICRRLDGLPLALELVAARLGAFTLQDVADGLAGRLDLSSAVRTVESRHRTLREALDWSYGLLTTLEQRLLARLSVFAGEFTLAHAQQVCSDPALGADQVVEVLASLIGKSMVLRPDSGTAGRYRMLETVRLYAYERLVDRGESEARRKAHGLCLIDFAERAAEGLTSPDEATWAARIDAELNNLRIAHRWALSRSDANEALRLSAALHRYAFWRMRYEVLQWAAPAADLESIGQHPLAAVVLASAGIGAWTGGDLDTAAERGHLATRLAAPVQGLPDELVGDVALFGGQPAKAAEAYHRAAGAFSRSGDLQAEVFNRGSRAISLAYAGQPRAAIAAAAETSHLAATSQNPTARAYASYAEGECLLDQDQDRALDLLEDARQISDAVGNEFVSGVAAVSIASLRARHGDAVTALRSFDAVIARWRRTGNWMQQWTTLRNLGYLLVRLGEDRTAAILLAAATVEDRTATVYGPETARMAAARARLAERLGEDALTTLDVAGRRLTGEQAVTLAGHEIHKILAGQDT